MIVWGGGWFLKSILTCVFLEFPPGQKTFNYSGPFQQWGRTRIRETLSIIIVQLINQVPTLRRVLLTMALVHNWSVCTGDVSVVYNWSLCTGDVSVAFLHAAGISYNLVMRPPHEFYNEESRHIVWRLNKAVYGLR